MTSKILKKAKKLKKLTNDIKKILLSEDDEFYSINLIAIIGSLTRKSMQEITSLIPEMS